MDRGTRSCLFGLCTKEHGPLFRCHWVQQLFLDHTNPLSNPSEGAKAGRDFLFLRKTKFLPVRNDISIPVWAHWQKRSRKVQLSCWHGLEDLAKPERHKWQVAWHLARFGPHHWTTQVLFQPGKMLCNKKVARCESGSCWFNVTLGFCLTDTGLFFFFTKLC